MSAKRIILAEYFTAEDAILLFLVREDFEQPLVRKIKISLDDIRQFVTDNFGTAENGTSRARELDVDDWQKRFVQLVSPILPHAEEGDIIWFVPHDALHYLPLHALRVEGRYLIERNPVCYTPSASVMKFCHAKRKGRCKKALVIGDSRSDLMYAREEARTVAALFETTPYLQDQATKSLVKEKLEQERDELDVLHFSCHGYFSPTQPLKSGIVFAPEQDSKIGEESDHQWNLTAEEIFNLSMHADLVTLSACETGINERKPGDELIGLTRALIYAGTPSVIVSLWAVDDLSTGLLMEHFYQQLRQLASMEQTGRPRSKAEALQTAQVYVKNLTAQQVMDYCNRGLEALGQPEDDERILHFQLGEANMRLIAGDVDAALGSFRNLRRWLDGLSGEWARDWSNRVDTTMQLLEFKASARLSVSYEVKPFEHPYYWAPFVLIGDWK